MQDGTKSAIAMSDENAPGKSATIGEQRSMPITVAESNTVKWAETTISSSPIPSDALREHAERGMVDSCSAVARETPATPRER